MRISYYISCIIILSALAFTDCPGQTLITRYWVEFTDKAHTPYTLAQPEEFLSERALARREQQSIALTEQDLPVDPAYTDSLKNLGIEIIQCSKWLNGAIISSIDQLLIDTLENIGFIKSSPVLIIQTYEFMAQKRSNDLKDCMAVPVYGYSSNQITMLRGDYLHNLGYEGQTMLIGVLDAGYTQTNVVSSMESLWENDQIYAYRDFVKDNTDIFNSSNHGTIVLSIIGGQIAESIYGVATGASFVLCRTEDISSEYIIEEYNWVCGAEYADSLGADIITSSLGYTTFNDPSTNHSYANMDGHSTPASIGASIAASKGIVVVVSAGNQGDNSWLRIDAPADADSILTVGAVDPTGQLASFSSRGPSFDGRVKPDICAQGILTYGQTGDGNIIGCAGTSCAAPLISGMTACLWQANPEATNMQIIEAIRKSGSTYTTPDSLCGYGIPDFMKADLILKRELSYVTNQLITFNILPNPANDYFILEVYDPGYIREKDVLIRIFDISGRIVNESIGRLTDKFNLLEFYDINFISGGIYTVTIIIDQNPYSLLLIKTN